MKDLNRRLFSAVEKNNLVLAQKLLDLGADVNSVNSRGQHLLHIAYTYGIIRLLLERGANINASYHGITALHYAAERGDSAIVNMLIENGANVHAKDENGRTPLHYAATRTLSNPDVPKSPIVRTLVSAGAHVDTIDRYGKTPLHIVSETGNIDAAVALIELKADVNRQCSYGYTPLHYAIIEENIDVVKVLIKARANVNAVDKIGQSLLHIVSEKGNADILRVLIEANAHINICDAWGQTALHIAAKYQENTEFVELLIKAGAKMDCKEMNGNTPAHVAIAFDNYKAAVCLIKNGANPNIKNRYNETVFDLIRSQEGLSIIKAACNHVTAINRINEDSLQEMKSYKRVKHI